MTLRVRPPLRHCPICHIAMQARKSAAHISHFDTFECLTCETTIVEQPASPARTPSGRNDKS